MESTTEPTVTEPITIDWAMIEAIATDPVGGGITLGVVLALTYLGVRIVRKRRAAAAEAAKKLPLLLALLALPMLGGCSLLSSLDAAYVAADRATFDAVAPLHRAFLSEEPPVLSDGQRALARGTVAAWELRLLTAEGSDE